MAAKMVPTACRLPTPSASRAPPECHRPMIGTPRRTASLYAVTMAAHPSSPEAPPWTRGSEANATAPVPSICPVPAMAPVPVSGAISSRVPSSNRASSRTTGSRDSVEPAAGDAGAGPAAAGAAGGGAARSLSVAVTWFSLHA